MNNPTQIITDDLDKEWIELLFQAQQLGISSQEIKDFFNLSRNKRDFTILSM